MTIIGIAFAGMRRRRLRTLLTILSVVIAIGVFTLTLATRAILTGMIQEANENPRVVVASPNSALSLPIAYVEQIKKMPGVTWTFFSRTMLGDDGRGTFKFPVIASNWESVEHQTPVFFRPDNQESVEKARNDKHWLRATPSLLTAMNWKVGDRVTFHTLIGNVTGTIYGTCSGFACTQAMMFMDYDSLDQLFPPQARSRISFVVAGTTAGNQLKLARSIDENFANSSDPTLTLEQDEFIRANFMRSVGAIPKLLSIVSIILLVVTCVVMISTLLVSMRERRSEFGTLRAIGFSRARVFSVIVFEAILMCLIGGLLGAAIPFVLFFSKGIHMGGFAMASVLVTGRVVLEACAAAAVLGVVVALIPALGVTRMGVLESLEGT
jgi:putative ABC transport system permease protein